MSETPCVVSYSFGIGSERYGLWRELLSKVRRPGRPESVRGAKTVLANGLLLTNRLKKTMAVSRLKNDTRVSQSRVQMPGIGRDSCRIERKRLRAWDNE